ncbi:H-type small acid-soluble spore protein [Domibacillus sp. 8LH]|jgi:small acid-soluble spore protein H (minor)|uniref:H-type small acid-soluble spore protein n=1 Tax=Domibacillus TaxID=1433999 RepID=UPI001F58DABC|nr:MULTISPECIES: H-type small acid-soluble spore protein [Domibacillus]MCI2253379.1 H-type small acid-soluble spore protein [Domibacillus sp. PGB-M46]MCM3787837.1 H-type small acid-soluble spore protein [Domibacillus indicus]
MELQRAKQIVSNSSVDIDVEFNGVSVWIDEVHEDTNTATVHLRGPGEERTQVGIEDLKEVTH